MPDFYVPLTTLTEQDAFTIPVGNGSGIDTNCNDRDDYTASRFAFKWSGTVSFVRIREEEGA